MRKVILALAGKAAQDTVRDRPVEILLSENLGKQIAGEPSDDADAERQIREFILGISGDSLREGISFQVDPSVGDGVSMRVVGEDLQLDLDDTTITRFLMRHLLPRYRQILQGKHDAETSDE